MHCSDLHCARTISNRVTVTWLHCTIIATPLKILRTYIQDCILLIQIQSWNFYLKLKRQQNQPVKLGTSSQQRDHHFTEVGALTRSWFGLHLIGHMNIHRSRPRPTLIIPHRKHVEFEPPSHLGNLSPDLQPSSPPTFQSGDPASHLVSKVGKYLLTEKNQTPDGSKLYQAVHSETLKVFICKVSFWFLKF